MLVPPFLEPSPGLAEGTLPPTGISDGLNTERSGNRGRGLLGAPQIRGVNSHGRATDALGEHRGNPIRLQPPGTCQLRVEPTTNPAVEVMLCLGVCHQVKATEVVDRHSVSLSDTVTDQCCMSLKRE